MPNARKTDRATSHEAAQSVVEVTDTQLAIYKLLTKRMTDEELVQAYLTRASLNKAPWASVSGIRSRRSELERKGLVREVGFAKSKSGRRATVWGRA